MQFSEQKIIYTIIVFVIAMHCCLIAGLAFQRNAFRSTPPRQRVIVQTIAVAKEVSPKQQIQREAMALVAKNEVAIPKADIETTQEPQKSSVKEPIMSESIKKANSVVKKPVVKPVVKPEVKKHATKVLPPVPKVVPKQEQTSKPMRDVTAEAEETKKKELLAEIRKNIVDSVPTKLTSEGTGSQRIILSPPPKMLSTFQSDTLLSNDFNYDHELARKLKLLLQLPQYGEVEVQMTLFRSGKVAKLIILSSANAVNKEHVEKILPTLTFPPFGSTFAGEEQHTFRITLSNAL